MPKTKFIVWDRKLQLLANKKDKDALTDAADEALDLDDMEGDDAVGSVVAGVEIGIRLAAKVAKTKGASVFAIPYPVYDDGDGIALLVGTKKQVSDKIKALPINEDEEEDEGDY